MVQKFLNLLNKEAETLHQAAFFLGFFAILSQILALFRDKLLALTFGAGSELDIYYAAFRIPDFIFVTVGSLISISVLVPALSRVNTGGEVEQRRFIDSIFSFFCLLVIGVAVIAFFLMPQLLAKVFPGISGEGGTSLLNLARILLLSPIILGVSNLFGSIAQSKNRFFVYALSPILYNVGIIIGIIWLYPNFGLSGLGYGVILGALLHMLIQAPSVYAVGLFPRFSPKINFSLIRETILVSLPRTFTLSLNHLAILGLLFFASFFPAGSITVFNFAFNLQSIGLSVIGMSYSLAAFPSLTRAFSLKDSNSFLSELVISARHIIFWSVPFVVMFIVLRAHIVRVVLGAGEFDWTDTRLTAAALALFVLSLFFQNITLLFIRAMYAAGETKTPLWVNLFSALLIVTSAAFLLTLFNTFETVKYFLESILKVSDLSGTMVLVLPLAYTIGSIFGAMFLWFFTEKKHPGFSKSILPTLFQSSAAWIIGGFVTFLSLRVLNDIFSLERFGGVLAQGLFSGIFGIIASLVVLKLLRSQELADIWAVLHKKFWKTKVLGPDPEVV
jgi:putative peptidoglycan lipid II flippase